MSSNREEEKKEGQDPSPIGPPADAVAQPPLRHPGHSSFAGLSAPLVRRSRDARSQVRQSGRSAVREVSSSRDEDRKGWQNLLKGKTPCR